MKHTVKKSEEEHKVTLDEAFDEFITEKEASNLSQKTIGNYTYAYKAFTSFTRIENCEDFKIQQIYKWMNTLKLQGVKEISVKSYINNLKTFCIWCADESRGYMKPVKWPAIRVQEESLKLFTDDEIAILLEKPKRNDSFATWRSWAIVNWVLGTGNRCSTFCSVQIKDINYAHHEIVLPHTKNKKAQVIPLSSSLEGVMKEYIRMWRKDAGLNDYLFPNVGNERLTPDGFRQSFERYCKARGLKHWNVHGLRHNFAKAWVQNNGNMFALQKILGHTQLDMTRRYVTLFSEDIKQDFDKFNPLDNIKKNQRRTQKVMKSYQ